MSDTYVLSETKQQNKQKQNVFLFCHSGTGLRFAKASETLIVSQSLSFGGRGAGQRDGRHFVQSHFPPVHHQVRGIPHSYALVVRFLKLKLFPTENLSECGSPILAAHVFVPRTLLNWLITNQNCDILPRTLLHWLITNQNCDIVPRTLLHWLITNQNCDIVPCMLLHWLITNQNCDIVPHTLLH